MRSRFKFLFALFVLLAPAAKSRAEVSTGTLTAGPAAPAIARLVAGFLEQGQYSHKPITAGTSGELKRLYLRMYDPSRMFFLASDIAEFNSRFGPDMATRLKAGDVDPGYFIVNRFMKRLRERVGWTHELVRSTFTFASGDTMETDRRKAPWPADEAAARGIWRRSIEFDMLQEKLNGAKPAEWGANVRKTYDRLLYNYKELDSADVLQSYLTALSACYDPHSEYLGAPAEENFDIALGISLVGIGVTLQEEEGYAKIYALVPGGPAAKSGAFHVNDRIAAVAQGTDGPFVEAAGMKLDRLVKLIRGEKGTIVRLKLIPADALDPSTRVTVTLTRDKILLKDQQAKAQIVLVPGKGGRDLRLGVIDLSSFYSEVGPSGQESTSRDVKTLLDYLKRHGVAGVILDLRDNGGGSLDEAVVMTGLFTGGGPVVQARDSTGQLRVLNAPETRPDYAGPLVVLDSRFSASASEIVAAALKDYRRAVLVGDKTTYGKGTVQVVVDLDKFMPEYLRRYKAGGEKLTYGKFYRVSGGSTQNRGVPSDIALPSLNDYMDVGESTQPNALAYDEIPPAPHSPGRYVTRPEIARLKAASEARVAASPDFKFVRQAIALYLKHKKEKTISLNYAVRLAERNEEEARKTERNKERAARGIPPLSVTDITLEDIAAGKPLVFTSTAAMEAAYSAAAGPAVSTAAVTPAVAASTATAAGVRVSTSAVEGGGYAKAPLAGDFVLEEAARILADMIAQPQAQAASRVKKAAK